MAYFNLNKAKKLVQKVPHGYGGSIGLHQLFGGCI